MQRFKFNTCVRQSGEKIAVYVARLRELTQFCEFGDSLEDMLRNRLVCGVNDERDQRRLLAEPQLTFKKAMELSQTFESSMQDAKDLQSSSRVPRAGLVNAINEQKAEMYRCGGQHNPFKCKYKEFVCHNCKKKGYLAKRCHQCDKSGTRKSPHPKSTHHIGTESTDTKKEAEDGVYTMFTLPSSKQDPIKIIVDVDNFPLSMELDTGTSHSIISETVCKNLPSVPKLEPTSANFTTYTGESIKVLGSITAKVCHNGQEKCLPLLVVSGEGPSLLGRNWIHHLKLDWTSIFCL